MLVLWQAMPHGVHRWGFQNWRIAMDEQVVDLADAVCGRHADDGGHGGLGEVPAIARDDQRAACRGEVG